MLSNVKRTPVKYFGGKFALAPWVISHFPDHEIYVEPFGGGGGVLLRKQPSRFEVYNDIDGEVVNLFQVLRNPTEARELVELIANTPFARKDYEEAYLPTQSTTERCRRFIVRSHLGYGSATSDTKKRVGFLWMNNHCYAEQWARLPEALREVTLRLKRVTIEHDDALRVMTRHDSPETLHYVDPPYALESRASDKRYPHDLTEQDQRKLAQTLKGLKGKVFLSGYPSALYNELYGDWKRVERPHYALGGRKVTECLWSNCDALEAVVDRNRPVEGLAAVRRPGVSSVRGRPCPSGRPDAREPQEPIEK